MEPPRAQERQLEIEDLLDRNEELEAWNVEFQHGCRVVPYKSWAEKSRLLKFLEYCMVVSRGIYRSLDSEKREIVLFPKKWSWGK